MMTKDEKKRQAIIAAKLQAEINARKGKNVVAAGNQPSQWGKVVQNETRLIDNGHYMKTSVQASLSYLRENYAKLKKEKKGQVFRLVRKENGKTIEVLEKAKRG